jgi:hypothetical protein
MKEVPKFRKQSLTFTPAPSNQSQKTKMIYTKKRRSSLRIIFNDFHKKLNPLNPLQAKSLNATPKKNERGLKTTLERNKNLILSDNATSRDSNTRISREKNFKDFIKSKKTADDVLSFKPIVSKKDFVYVTPKKKSLKKKSKNIKINVLIPNFAAIKKERMPTTNKTSLKSLLLGKRNMNSLFNSSFQENKLSSTDNSLTHLIYNPNLVSYSKNSGSNFASSLFASSSSKFVEKNVLNFKFEEFGCMNKVCFTESKKRKHKLLFNGVKSNRKSIE